MPDTTVTVRKDGTGDYTTIVSAEAAANISTGYYKIEIDDSSEYSGPVVVNVSGTPTINNYVWITVSEGNRHAGVAGTGHARLRIGQFAAGVDLDSDYARLEYLEIDGAGNAASCAYIKQDNILVSRCIMHGAQRGMNWLMSTTSAIDNCLIYDNDIGIFTGTNTSINLIDNVDYCTIVDNAGSLANETNIRWYMFRTNETVTANLYNVVLGDGNNQDMYVEYNSNRLTLNGSHNAWDTDTSQLGSATNNLTNSQDISSGGVTTITTTANAYIVDDLSPGAENYTPVPATGAGSNLVLGNGVNRQGSEPDPRQDFSTDIRGAARPTSAGKIDIGAFQITTAAGFKYWDGSAWADSTAVQYWNGSAWTDVTGIQYWNGSAWTDPS